MTLERKGTPDGRCERKTSKDAQEEEEDRLKKGVKRRTNERNEERYRWFQSGEREREKMIDSIVTVGRRKEGRGSGAAFFFCFIFTGVYVFCVGRVPSISFIFSPSLRE
jgi:hypothetical protein